MEQVCVLKVAGEVCGWMKGKCRDGKRDGRKILEIA